MMRTQSMKVSPKKKAGEQLPAPEKAASPEQIKGKQPDSRQ